MSEVTEQRPMNNENINSWISKLPPVTLAGIFKLYSKFLSTLQTRNTSSTLSGKSNYVVEEFSAERQRVIISWDHYLTS